MKHSTHSDITFFIIEMQCVLCKRSPLRQSISAEMGLMQALTTNFSICVTKNSEYGATQVRFTLTGLSGARAAEDAVLLQDLRDDLRHREVLRTADRTLPRPPRSHCW